jgi:hypothetical protein
MSATASEGGSEDNMEGTSLVTEAFRLLCAKPTLATAKRATTTVSENASNFKVLVFTKFTVEKPF